MSAGGGGCEVALVAASRTSRFQSCGREAAIWSHDLRSCCGLDCGIPSPQLMRVAAQGLPMQTGTMLVRAVLEAHGRDNVDAMAKDICPWRVAWAPCPRGKLAGATLARGHAAGAVFLVTCLLPVSAHNTPTKASSTTAVQHRSILEDCCQPCGRSRRKLRYAL